MSFYGCSDSLIVAIKTPRHRLLFRPAWLILFRQPQAEAMRRSPLRLSPYPPTWAMGSRSLVAVY